MEKPTLSQNFSSIGSLDKKRKKTIIQSYSSYEEDSSDTDYSDSELEEGQSSRFIHGIKRPIYIPNPYFQRPRTRPKNKLILTSNIIANPALMDEIINIDDSPENEAKKKKTHQKNQT